VGRAFIARYAPTTMSLLPEADDPFRAEDCLPDRHKHYRQNHDGDQQGDREEDPGLFEIGQRDQGRSPRRGRRCSGGSE
jgi:hypothetical protein